MCKEEKATRQTVLDLPLGFDKKKKFRKHFIFLKIDDRRTTPGDGSPHKNPKLRL